MKKQLYNMAEAIKQARKYKKISQTELAERANVTQTYISHLERGATFPQRGKLESIASVLDLEIVFELRPKGEAKNVTKKSRKKTKDTSSSND